MNKIILMARLTRDPEVRYSQGENSMAIASFSVATNRKFKRDGEPDADFFNCTAFGKQAEFVEKYLKKGTKILLSGRVYSVRIMVEEIEFAESKGTSDAGTQQATTENNGFMNIPDGLQEELPFA